MIKLRAVAIINSEDRVLLHKAPNDDFWALPGGNVELNEASEHAVRRELFEELGIEIGEITLSIIAENFFQHADKTHHEIGFYYRATLTSSIKSVIGHEEFHGKEINKGLLFRWFNRADLSSIKFQPSFLTDVLKMDTSEILHVSNKNEVL